VRDVRRLGKRIVLGLDDDLFLVIHLMIAGRLRWLDAVANRPAHCARGSRIRERKDRIHRSRHEASSVAASGARRRRACTIRHGGLEVGDSSLADFAARLRKENHTLKRALTDPRLFSGIGNAYSDEILHRARLSPLALTHKLAERCRATVRRDA